jgi:hypothetical protein
VDVANELGRGREIVLRSDAGDSQRAAGARGPMHHQTCFLLERHPADEILCAPSRSEAPVFVRVDEAVSVEISEAESPLCDDRR